MVLEPVGVLKSEQLEALVGPTALYPETLPPEVLTASTYPPEVGRARLLGRRPTTKI